MSLSPKKSQKFCLKAPFSFMIWLTYSSLSSPNLFNTYMFAKKWHYFDADTPLFVSLLFGRILGFGFVFGCCKVFQSDVAPLVTVRWFQSDVAPLLSGLQLFKSDGQGTGVSTVFDDVNTSKVNCGSVKLYGVWGSVTVTIDLAWFRRVYC